MINNQIMTHRMNKKLNSDNKQITCRNCSTTVTPLWRRGVDGKHLCNACGLYYKIHQKDRPHELKTDSIRSRIRTKQDVYEYSGYKKNLVYSYSGGESNNKYVKDSKYSNKYVKDNGYVNNNNKYIKDNNKYINNKYVNNKYETEYTNELQKYINECENEYDNKYELKLHTYKLYPPYYNNQDMHSYNEYYIPSTNEYSSEYDVDEMKEHIAIEVLVSFLKNVTKDSKIDENK